MKKNLKKSLVIQKKVVSLHQKQKDKEQTTINNN